MQSDASSALAQQYRARFCASARRVGEWVCTYFRDHAADRPALDEQRALLWQAIEANYYYAQDWAMVVACAQVGHAAMMRGGYWTQWGELLTLALAAAQQLGDPAVIAQFHYWLGTVRHRQSHWITAAEHYAAAAAGYQALGDRFWVPRIWCQLSEQYRERGDWQQAATLAHQARVAQEANGDAVGLAATYSALGHLAFRRNEADAALHWLQQALAIPALAQDPEIEAGVHSRLGNLYALREALPAAHHHYTASRAIAQRAGDDSSLGNVLLNHAVLYAEAGEITTALELTLQARACFTRCGDRQGVALVHFNLAATYPDIGQNELALAEGEQAIRLVRQLGDLDSLSLALCNQAETLYRQGELHQAALLVDEAKRVSHQMTDATRRQDLIVWLEALLLAASGDHPRALAQLPTIWRQLATYADRPYLFFGLLDMVEVALAAQAWGAAAEWLAQARTIAQELERSDLLGLVEQWSGDAARGQGDVAQAQTHYTAAAHAFAAKPNDRHRYLQNALQYHLAHSFPNGVPISAANDRRD